MPDERLPKEDQPDIRPHSIPEIKAAEESKGDSQTSDAEKEGSGFYNPKPDEASQSGSTNEYSTSKEGGLYNENPTEHSSSIASAISPTAIKGFFFGTKRRKNTTIGGGIIALLFSFAIFGITTLSGPAQLVQLSQILQRNFHHSNNSSVSRANKLLRFANSEDVGETRLGVLGKQYLRDLVTKLNDIGIEFETNSNGNLKATIIDTEKLAKNYPELKNLDEAQKRTWLSEKFNVIGDAEFKPIGNGKFVSDATDVPFKTLGAINKNILSLLGEGKIQTALNERVLAKYFDIPSLFHPLQRAKASQIRKLHTVADRKADEEKQQQDENSTTEEKASSAVDETKSKSSLYKSTAMKALLLTGGACFLRSIADDIVTINRDRIVLPSVIQAANFIAIGEQIKSNQDVSAEQVNQLDESLANNNGDTVWQAKALQADETVGTPGGKEISQDYRQAFSSDTTASTIRTWADSAIGGNGPASVVCSPAGILVQLVGGVFLAASTAVADTGSGGTLTPALASLWAAKFSLQFAVSAVAMHFIQTFIINGTTDAKLAKDAFSGPVGGNLLAYGAREAANIGARAEGGVALSGTKNVTQTVSDLNNENRQFESESFFARVFDINDSRSLFGHLIDFISPSIMHNITSSLSGIGSIGSSIISNVSSIFSTNTSADTNNYDWGTPIVGIPDSVVNNPNYADPYANSQQVAIILAGPDGQSYIDRAQKCFGVQISNDSGSWNVTADQMVNPQMDDYTNANCDKYESDTNWQRVMLFVFDTHNMQSMACYQGDDTSCQEIGYQVASGNNSSSSSSTNTNGNLPNSPSQDLARQLINNSNVNKNGTYVSQDLADAANGKPASAGKPLSHTLLSLLVYMAQNHSFNISALESGGSGHSGPGDPHYEGDAADITAVDGDPIANSGIGRTAHDQAIIKEIAPLMPPSSGSDFPHWSGFGQDNCGSTPPLPSGIKSFSDTCSHLHIQIPVGSP